MAQSIQGHTVIIEIQLDNSGDALRYEVNKVKLVEGKIPGNDDPAAQIHFDCFHCNAKYFIWPEIVVKLELVPNANTRVDVKKEPELNLLESGGWDEVLSEDEGDIFQGVGQDMAHVLPVENEEIQESAEPLVDENLIQIQPLDLQPFVRLVQIDDEKKTSIKYRKNLTSHMKLHTGNRYSCSECPKSFYDKSGLNRHKKLVHQSESRNCEVCSWSKTCTKVEYHSHLRRRHPELRIKGRQPNMQNFNGVDFPCCYCEPQVIFRNFEELTEHLGGTHDRNFACARCPKAFGDTSSLKRHIDSVHDEKMFSCTYCDKVFSWKISLRKHLLSHNM